MLLLLPLFLRNMKISLFALPLFFSKIFLFLLCVNVEHFRLVSLKRELKKFQRHRVRKMLFVLDNSECQNSTYTRIGSLISSFCRQKDLSILRSVSMVDLSFSILSHLLKQLHTCVTFQTETSHPLSKLAKQH